ncbi:unnamed protein product [Urochloa humidicola]
METAEHHQREDELRSHYPDDNAGGHERKKKSSLSSCQTAILDQDENRELNQWVPTTSSTTCSTKCLHGLVEPLGSSEDPETPDYFDDVDFDEEKR